MHDYVTFNGLEGNNFVGYLTGYNQPASTQWMINNDSNFPDRTLFEIGGLNELRFITPRNFETDVSSQGDKTWRVIAQAGQQLVQVSLNLVDGMLILFNFFSDVWA